MDDWESFPLFAPEGAEIPRIAEDETAENLSPALGALAHLLYDEETAEEISEQHRDIGNRLFRKGRRYVRSAIKEYTEAIDANCDIPEVTAAAYSNRAAAHLKLKNYGRCLADCEKCILLQPSNLKARYRAAVSATAIMRFDTAIKHCDAVLQAIRDGAGDKDQKLLFEKTRRAAEEARQHEENRTSRAEKRKQEEEARLKTRAELLGQRGITMGMPLFAQQRKYTRKEPTVVDGKLYWPVLMVYPEEVVGDSDQSDYLEEVSEDATLADIVATVFPAGAPAPPWDIRAAYRDHTQLEVLFRQEWTLPEDEADSDDERSYVGSMRGPEEVGAWRTLPLSCTVKRALATTGYVVPMFPVFYLVPRGTYLS